MINTEYKGTHSWLLEYILKCRLKEIIIGQELMLMLNKLFDYFSDPAITIDFADAHKRIKFIEKECKHFESPFAGQPFILELFQKAFIEAIYSFKIYDEEVGRLVRLFQDILYLVGRKNGKTPLISAICLAEWFCGPMGLKILCTSNDYEQADLMFQAINAMREESRTLEKVTRKNLRGMFFGNPRRPKKHGKFSYMNKGNIRKLSAKTGAKEARNLGVAAADEVHELKDNTPIMPVRQSLSTQDEPLYFELTTEGLVNEGYLDGRLRDARAVLVGELDRPRWLIWLYTQDSEQEVWQDESSWVKSNPGLGVIKKWSYLRAMVEEARTDKGTRVFVLSKDFNIKQSQAEAWLSKEEFENDESFDIEELRGGIGIAAIDLSETTDLTCAKIMVMLPGNRFKKYFITKYFIPETKVEKGQSEDKKNYLEWARMGFIEICPGNEIDQDLVFDWILMIRKQFGIRIFKIGYDNWQAKGLVKKFEDAGFETERVKMDYDTLSNPMKHCEADFKSKNIVYNMRPHQEKGKSKSFGYGKNEVDEWCIGNTGISVDKLGRIMPVKIKGQPNKRIDGGVTKIIAYTIFGRYRTEYLEMVA